MGSFADTHLAGFTCEQLDAYEALLEHGDLDVYNWIMGSVPIPETFNNEVTQRLVTHHFAGTKAS